MTNQPFFTKAGDAFIPTQALAHASDRGHVLLLPTGYYVLGGALAVAVHAEVGTDQLAQMMYAYPTFHRAIEDALRDLREQSGDG